MTIPDVDLSAVIVTNGSDNLEYVVKNAKEVGAEDIVVVNTISEYPSFDAVNELGARFVGFHGDFDFSSARNRGIEQSFGKWVLMIDDDERIDPSQRGLINQLIESENHDRYSVQQVTFDHGCLKGFFPQPRLFKRENYQFDGQILEWLYPLTDTIDTDLLIYNEKNMGEMDVVNYVDRLKTMIMKEMSQLRDQEVNSDMDSATRYLSRVRHLLAGQVFYDEVVQRYQENMLDRAKLNFDWAQREEPLNQHILFEYSYILNDIGKGDEAKHILSDIEDLDNISTPYLVDLSWTRLQLGDKYERVVEPINKAIERNPSARFYMERSRMNRMLGKTREMLEDIRSASQLNPEIAKYHQIMFS